MEKNDKVRAWRVLIVDDNLDAAEMLGMALRLMGAETTVASDGAAAIEALKAFTPDVIIADAHMPGMDGDEMATRIRADADNKDVLLIALTGDSRKECKERLFAAGFDRYALKPATLDDLWQMIEERCSAHALTSSSADRLQPRRVRHKAVKTPTEGHLPESRSKLR
jgi:CheY-like chemotaxis protein